MFLLPLIFLNPALSLNNSCGNEYLLERTSYVKRMFAMQKHIEKVEEIARNLTNENGKVEIMKNLTCPLSITYWSNLIKNAKQLPVREENHVLMELLLNLARKGARIANKMATFEIKKLHDVDFWTEMHHCEVKPSKLMREMRPSTEQCTL